MTSMGYVMETPAKFAFLTCACAAYFVSQKSELNTRVEELWRRENQVRLRLVVVAHRMSQIKASCRRQD